MRIFSLISIIAAFCTINATAQKVIRNFGFEDVDANGRMVSWELGNTKQKYALRLDTSVSRTGKCSFVIEMTDTIANRGSAGASSSIIAPNIGAKRVVTISAFIKTDKLQDGIAAIGMQLNGANGPLREINSNSQSQLGTTDWTKHIIELSITPDVKFIRLGLHTTAKGKVWFDDIQVTFDDVPLGSDFLIP